MAGYVICRLLFTLWIAGTNLSSYSYLTIQYYLHSNKTQKVEFFACSVKETFSKTFICYYINLSFFLSLSHTPTQTLARTNLLTQNIHQLIYAVYKYIQCKVVICAFSALGRAQVCYLGCFDWWQRDDDHWGRYWKYWYIAHGSRLGTI